jgi:hypothetical protein
LNARGQLTSGVSGLGTSITSEAAGYLIPLLSLDKDRDEIATLQERIRILGTGPRGITPIVIPLNDNAAPADLVDMSASVTFDADGTGWKKQWTWITPKAAWLVFSPKGARTVDSALQLFGNVTFWMFWQNGYQALQAIDDDDSGALSGPELRDLALWRDANSNGIAEDGEVRTLSESGIVSVNTRYEDTRSRSDYVAFSKEGVTFKDGRTRPTYDVILYGKRKPTE